MFFSNFFPNLDTWLRDTESSPPSTFVMSNEHLKSLVSGLSVSEYVDFLESRALHLGVSPFELSLEYHYERGLVSMVKHDMAKAELWKRDMEEALWSNES